MLLLHFLLIIQLFTLSLWQYDFPFGFTDEEREEYIEEKEKELKEQSGERLPDKELYIDPNLNNTNYYWEYCRTKMFEEVDVVSKNDTKYYWLTNYYRVNVVNNFDTEGGKRVVMWTHCMEAVGYVHDLKLIGDERLQLLKNKILDEDQFHDPNLKKPTLLDPLEREFGPISESAEYHKKLDRESIEAGEGEFDFEGAVEYDDFSVL